MGKILNFPGAEKEDIRMNVRFPTVEEIALLRGAAQQFDTETELLPIDLWDGTSWKSFFDKWIIPQAEKSGVDPWDAFAVIMTKLIGTEFFEDVDGLHMQLGGARC